MLNVSRILVGPFGHRHALAACVVGALTGCGQRGPLFIPTAPAAAERATLGEALRRSVMPTPPSPPPATGTAAPLPMP